MSKSTQQKMHQQHAVWKQDYDTWMADVDVWKKEIKHALSDLDDIEAMLLDCLEAAQTHCDNVWENRQRLKAHEMTLGKESRLNENKTDQQWKHRHEQQASDHVKLADAHERIKKHHYSMLSETKKLWNKAFESL